MLTFPSSASICCPRWSLPQLGRFTVGRLVLAGLCIFGVFGTASAQADPITYVEAISGDLPKLASSSAIFGFDVGLNTVSGTILGFSVTQSADFDSFAFSIPAGAELSSINYSFVTTFNPDIAQAGSNFNLSAGILESSPVLGAITIAGMAPSPAMSVGAAFTSVLPLQPGVYAIHHGGLFFRNVSDFSASGFSQAFTWSFTVQNAAAPVPEPATLSLLALSLAGLGVRRWRHRKTSERSPSPHRAERSPGLETKG